MGLCAGAMQAEIDSIRTTLNALPVRDLYACYHSRRLLCSFFQNEPCLAAVLCTFGRTAEGTRLGRAGVRPLPAASCAGAVQAVDYEESLKAKMRIAGQLFELQGAEVLASEGFSRYFQENKVGAPVAMDK